MRHSVTDVKCLPLDRLAELIKAAYHEFDGAEPVYVTANTIGNLLLLNKDGKPIGIVDFAYDGNLDLWQEGE